MTKKTRAIFSVGVAIVLLILFLPIPKGTLDDGGTRVYAALTYKIVVWNKIQAEPGGEPTFYRHTSVYWFSDSHRSIDELWKMEWNGR